MGRDRAGARLDYRRAAGHGAYDRRPAADRVEPLFWRALRHAGRRFGILSPVAERAEVHDVRAGDGSYFRLAYIYGQLDGGGKTAGMVAATAHYIQRPEFCKSWIVGRHRRHRNIPG